MAKKDYPKGYPHGYPKDYTPSYPTNYPSYPKDYQIDWYPPPEYYTEGYPEGTKGAFEVSLCDPALSGGVSASVWEKGGVAPTNIVRIDKPWGVKINWYLEGTLVPFICGWWCLSLYFEGMGSPRGQSYAPKGEGYEEGYYDEEFDLKSEIKIPLNPCLELDENGHANYCYNFDIPEGTVKSAHCGRPYKLVAALTYNTCCDCPGPMAGFVELAMIQFYDPKTGHYPGKYPVK
ncbi:MAG: hypothetical protein L0226_17595 [Acidobacteria bacterium]|nr:hypothetical protein [Acidobacteriota bacterium]